MGKVKLDKIKLVEVTRHEEMDAGIMARHEGGELWRKILRGRRTFRTTGVNFLMRCCGFLFRPMCAEKMVYIFAVLCFVGLGSEE